MSGKKQWKEPEWMKRYSVHLSNTGGWITPEIAINCRGAKDGCDMFSNAPRALLCSSVHSQVMLLLRLQKNGLIQ